MLCKLQEKEKSPLSLQTPVIEENQFDDFLKEQRSRMKEEIAAKALLIATNLGDKSNLKGLNCGTYRYTDPPLSVIVKDYGGEKSIQVINRGQCVFLEENNEIREYIPGDDWEIKLRRIHQSCFNTTTVASG